MENGVFRILDANLNRAREGLRVIEEYLRFIREAPQGSWKLKQWRHTLREIVETLGSEKLLAARAAESDVGKDFTSPSNQCKTDPHAITAASFKRLEEALRVIEEYSASVNSSVNLQAGKMRFEVYQYEKELFAKNPRKLFEAVRLYLLIGSDFCPPEKMIDFSASLLDAGVDCLQLREKTLPDLQRLRLAEKLAKLCRDKNKLFIVNDRPDIAMAVGSDGVHVGQGDLPVTTVRRIVGPDRIIGLSTHNETQLNDAISLAPTYIALGPAFDTTTKPHEPTAGLDYISTGLVRLREAGIPEVVIGGITVKNLPELISIGVKRIALCSAILSADDPVRETGRFKSILTSQDK
jgi:thiamine-phosphate pyrophosphorylase